MAVVCHEAHTYGTEWKQVQAHGIIRNLLDLSMTFATV